mmetsp:Transcript_6450/g.15245  ORF Transcript_6450/g.15245 Transcript_6450/m.15245 type:complete len:206 (+) Transcript_6450:303-920(+)
MSPCTWCCQGTWCTRSPQPARGGSGRRGCMTPGLTPPCTTPPRTRCTPPLRYTPPRHSRTRPCSSTLISQYSPPPPLWCRRGTKRTACSRLPCWLSMSLPRTASTAPLPTRTARGRRSWRRCCCPPRHLSWSSQGTRCTTPRRVHQSKCSLHTPRMFHSPRQPCSSRRSTTRTACSRSPCWLKPSPRRRASTASLPTRTPGGRCS